MKRARIISLVCGVFVAVITGIIFTTSASAARTATQTKTSLVNKVLAQGVYNCYAGGHIKSSFDPVLGNYADVSSLLTSTASDNENFVPLVTGLNSSSIWSTAKYQVTDSGLSCAQFIQGGGYVLGGSNVGILAATGHTAPGLKDPEGITGFLKNMGYSVVSTDTEGSCYALKYQSSSGTGSTSQVCQDENGDIRVENSRATDIVKFYMKQEGGNVSTTEVCLSFKDSATTYTNGCLKKEEGETINGEWLLGLVNTTCGSMTCDVAVQTHYDGTVYRNKVTFSAALGGDLNNATQSLGLTTATFVNSSAEEAGLAAARFIFNEDSFTTAESLKISDTEKRLLYQDYLTSYYKVKIDCTAGLSDAAFDGKIVWFDEDKGGMSECHYETNGAENVNKPVNGIDENGFIKYESITNMNALLALFSADPNEGGVESDYSEEDIQELNSIASGTDYGNNISSTDALNNACYQNAEIEGISWIMCPAISNMSRAADGFERTISDWLSVDTSLYNNESQVYTVWRSFRDIANIIIILVLFAVIFSQLTGFGIDNYGIKKILPRLILMAVMINLSYIICQVLIDFSNILGVGLDDMFASIGRGASSGGINFNFVTTVVTILLAGGAAAGVAGAVITAGSAFVMGPMVVFSLVLTLLAVLVGVLIFFLTLGARMVIIIIFTAAAPVAFASYILPNTQFIFKQWRKVFEAALVVYPICGALYGVSSIIRNLFGTGQGGAMEAIIALLAPFLPFFVMPALLRGALNGLGQVGAALGTVGTGLRKGLSLANSGIKSTEAYETQQKAGKEAIQRERTRRALGIARKEGEPGAWGKSRELRRSMRRERYRGDYAKGRREALLNNDAYFESSQTRQDAEFSAEKEKGYLTLYDAESDRGAIERRLGELYNGRDTADAEEMSAVFRTLIDHGGTKEALQFMQGRDFNGLNKSQQELMIRNMANSDIDAFKTFAKYRQKGGKRNFSDWYFGRGITTTTDGKYIEDSGAEMDGQYMSFAGRWQYAGPELGAKLSKDEMEFVDENLSDGTSSLVGTGPGQISGAELGASLMRAAVYSKDVGTQNRAEKMIRDGLRAGRFGHENLGLTAQMLGDTKRIQTLEAIRDGMAERLADASGDRSIMEDTPEGLDRRNQLLRDEFSNVISEAGSYNKIRSSMQSDVRELVGIRDGSTGSGGPRAASASGSGGGTSGSASTGGGSGSATSGTSVSASSTSTSASGSPTTDTSAGGGTSGDSASDDATLHIEHNKDTANGGRRTYYGRDIADGYETPPTPPPSGDSTSPSDDASSDGPYESDIY